MKRLSLILLLAAIFASNPGTVRPQAAQQAAAPAPRSQARAFTPAKTPWGDPDLQGNYTNKYRVRHAVRASAGVRGPASRRRHGRRSIADAAKKRQEDTLENAKFFGGDPEGKIGNSAEFRDIYEVSRGSRAWLVVDPPDGKIPPMKPDARARFARPPGAGGLNGPEDFSLWTRCITRGFPGSMIPGRVRQLLSDHASTGTRRDPVRDGARHADHPSRRRSASRPARPPRHGRRARPLGRQHAGRRNDELQSAKRVSQRERRDAAHRRALYADGARARSSGRSRWMIRPPGRGRGRSPCR